MNGLGGDLKRDEKFLGFYFWGLSVGKWGVAAFRGQKE